MKIGLFPGSFNPVHVGHLIIANHMLNFSSLDELWFVVSPQNPHKGSEEIAAENDRLEMMRLAIAHHPKLSVSDIEFSLPKPSYTINTLRHLKEIKPEIEPVLIIGQDNLDSFHAWKDHEEILERAEIFVYPRRMNSNHAYLASTSPYVNHEKVTMLDAPLLDISATYIRSCFEEGKDASFVLTKPVLDYIEEQHLYRN